MNAIAMMLQQVRQPVQSNSSGNQSSNDNSSIFQGLLDNEQATLAKDILQVLKGNDTPTNSNDLLALLKDSSGISDELYSMLEGSEELEQVLNDASSLEEVFQKLEALFSNFSVDQSLVQMDEQNNSNPVQFILADFFTKPAPINETAMQKQFVELFMKAEELLKQITNQQNVTKAAASLVKLLEQWSALEKSYNGDKNMLNSIVTSKNPEGAKIQTIWRELVQSFQKRNQLVTNQQYNSNAKVTTTDVTKWVQNALTSQSQMDTFSGQQVTSNSTMPITRLEQYVIHINQSQGSQTVDKQLIEQFQKVMKTSNFLAMNNGTSQLSIALRPENLGEMMVKFTQINGEMTVKIMVSSLAAKEMLESNMHQLKNMFSPQQVVIEKQDINTQQTQNFQNEQEEQAWNDSEQGQSHNSDEDDENGKSNDDFETQFHELLMNEKV